jgi:hypothetical protein
MVEFPTECHAPFQQRDGLIEASLRPGCGSQRHIDPRLRPVIRWGRTLGESVVEGVDRVPFALTVVTGLTLK